jgi:hypothetical protein
MADRDALLQAFDLHASQVNDESASSGGKTALARMLRQARGPRIGYFDREIATRMSQFFDPARARTTSPSFQYFWTCLESVMQR